jgi:EAL domain-containing protein (putative c-di-GMP-specific phosphodiesterase class I)
MVFEPRMAADTRDQAELLHDLRHAVANGELELYYQPKVRARGLRVTSAEALLRWHHPVRGLVSPGVFIPIAERYGLIRAIGHWVIEEACRQAAEWRDSGLRMRVAINVSATQLRADDFVDRLAAVLKSHRLKPSRFTCEITESVAMEDTQATQRAFERLHRAGLRVSIDDFGVGQASLSYLRRLPAAELKIDASFVRDLEQGAEARSIVEAVVRLAHALKLRVVAEGVETEAQAELLIQLGCDELQGYLFAKPMPARAVMLWASGQDDPARPRIADSLFHDTAPAPAAD